MTVQTRRHLIGRVLPGVVVGLGLGLLAVSPAGATPAAILKLQDALPDEFGDVGPQDTDGGAGAEQASVTHVMRDGKVYVVTVFMSSKLTEEQPGNWQCKCSSVELSANAAPRVVADQVTLGPYSDGDRLCNHPKISSDGTNVIWAYGSDKNGANNPKTYVGVLDHMCQETAEQIKISDDDNNNEAAPDIAYNGDGYFTAGYLSTNDNDRSVAVGLRINSEGGLNSLELMWRETIVAPSNIGRPAIGAIDAGRTLFCASKGDNRPPEDGIECAVLDSMTGAQLNKSIVAASQPEEHIYMNQPSLAQLEYGRWAIQALRSSGEGKTNNIKGSNTSHIYVADVDDGGITVRAEQEGLGSFQTHSQICGGAYGDEENRERVIGIYGAAVTGNGPPVLQIARYESNAGINQDVDNEKSIAGYYADSGKLANMYGHNPGNQGRDFLRCVGDVPNPSFGMEDGFLPSVESFFVVPHQGRTPGEPKNSQWLALVPGATERPLPPGPPSGAEDIPLGYEGEDIPDDPTGGDGDGDGDGNGAGDGDGDGSGDGEGAGAPTGTPSAATGNPAEPSNESSTGCACKVGTTPSSGNAALVAMAGLALALVSRRRKVS